MTPSISVRESIRWLPEPASEPTTTLVLTSEEHRFVDVRILKPTKPDQGLSGVLHSNQLEWAFAGTSSSELREDPNGEQVVHSIWHHWVDSRTSNAEIVTDEGDMHPQTSGRTLETGSMVNPDTGLMTEYEECWIDVDPLATNSGGEGKPVCTVLQLHDDDHEARGLVVRVGQYCQGILRVGESMSLERWEWEFHEGWKRLVRIGDLFVPCGVMLEGESLKLGGELRYGEFLWEVVEMSED